MADRPTRWLCTALLGLGLSVSAAPGLASADPNTDGQASRQIAVASAHPDATQAALDVLAQGGNAFDAAIALSAALGVVEPYSAGLGGGGFYLLHRASDGKRVMLDARERAPLAAHRDLYLDEHGDVIPGKSVNGALAAGIPGVPAALAHLADRYGKLPLKRSLAPAIRLAREGFLVTDRYRRFAHFRAPAMRQSAAASANFLLYQDAPPVGHLIRQPNMATTLEAIAERGHAGFYQGPVADLLVNAVRNGGGIWTKNDLLEYRVVERQPLEFHFGTMTITSVPPPSSGGVALATILNQLSELNERASDDVTRIHLLIEAMRRAYRDRAEYLGDSDFVDVPVARLSSSAHARRLIADIQDGQATPSSDLNAFDAGTGGNHTTHFSVVDAQGNRVAATLSINYPFGSGFVAAGTGVLLNDEMDDFSAKPGAMNVYGLVGSTANAIAPGKRMLSSMSPTFIDDERGFAVIGTPGGSRIITMVLLGILGYAQGDDAAALVARPRFHHQFLPDRIEFEPSAFSDAIATQLGELGHTLKPMGDDGYGNMQVVLYDRKNGALSAASDPRGEGLAAVCHDQDCQFHPANQ